MADNNPRVQALYEAFGKLADGHGHVDIINASLNMAADAMASAIVAGAVGRHEGERQLMGMAWGLHIGLDAMIEQLQERKDG